MHTSDLLFTGFLHYLITSTSLTNFLQHSNSTIQYSFISAQHICSVHVMSVIVVDIYINAGLGDSY